VGFLGRPPFRGASRREVACSRAAMNPAVPSGRPVWVHWRSPLSSVRDSPAARYPLHVAGVQRLCQGSMSNIASQTSGLQWAAALDHGHSIATDAIPARTGFIST
jgi:hypothetical protein